MEFLRFGSSIPGYYHGCCAADIIQNFNVDPDQKAAIEIVEGDGNMPMRSAKGEQLFAGPTYRDIFWQRLRFGTFSTKDMPNHAFLAIITDGQLRYDGPGKKWLAILKEAGFEFIRTINNSVYTGATVDNSTGDEAGGGSRNYLFGLFRGIGAKHAANPFAPPAEWTNLPGGKKDAVSHIPHDVQRQLTADARKFDLDVWDKIGPAKLITEAEAEKAGARIWIAGRRDGKRQHMKPTPQEAELAEAMEVYKKDAAEKVMSPTDSYKKYVEATKAINAKYAPPKAEIPVPAAPAG